MKEIEKLKEKILADYPRLNKDSKFTFRCHKDVGCFNSCCGDINIFLTPYDILRLKNRLGISSDEFLKKYTIMPFDENLKYPVALLKMSDNEGKTCQLVSKDGCTVYEDRPWACRMYPVGQASPDESEGQMEEFYFLLQEEGCKGFEEDKEWTIGEWITHEGIEKYDEMGKEFKKIVLHQYFQKAQNLKPQAVDMFHMACYDLDRFRRFLFDSTFFERYDVDSDTKDKIKNDDEALLLFGFKWLRYILFGEKDLLEVFPEAEKKLKSKIAKNKK